MEEISKEKLKDEFDEVINNIDYEYHKSISSSFLILFLMIIPCIILGGILIYLEKYYPAMLFLTIAFTISIFQVIYVIYARSNWKKQRDNAVYVFNIKLLQLSLHNYLESLESKSVDEKIDSTEKP